METSHSKTTEQALPQMAPSERFAAVKSFLAGRAGEIKREPRVCDEHGEYQCTLYPFGASTCPLCESEKIKREDEERQAKQAQEFRDRRFQQLLGRAAIPPRFSERRLSNFVPQCEGARRALEVATAYADNFELACETGASLILCGGVGTGKTHLAIGIAHAIMARDMAPVFTSVMGAVRAIKETYRKDSVDTESDVIKGFIQPDLLILDEVGVQFGSDTEKMYLFEIINGRYERLKPTIVISNLAKDALASFIGERAFDRLREGGGKLIAFDWPSYRRHA
ncbi:ATP-binding protein [Cupriavidus respiraculi]|uniref:AAA+ ATPase domain-containing protein n=1 Tax=Cupriavidus respiraculi TaxID=195930 RepID=A0ABN7YJZ1_9BURK|nr:ATP-binding protein [Cupriavidus respiraculi]CAG9172450.1 hypothetical protein LMG21510_01978 [Cupriavidus respiraculi]